MITSPRNPRVARAIRLKKRAFRERDARFLVEGAQAVREALAARVPLEILFHTVPGHPLVEEARRAGVRVVHVSEEVMHRLTSTVTPQGLVAVAPSVDVPLREVGIDGGCVAVLHAVRDPGNAGTVLRSADAAGARAVVFAGASVDVYNPKTVRASAGSVFHLPVVRGADPAEAVHHLRSRGAVVLAMDARGDHDLYDLDLTRPTAFLFGNEAWGLPEGVAGLADATVRVPIAGRAESLNLAAAATVCLFEWSRQRRQGRRAGLETLVAAAAHDLRSPLTAMKGFGFALQRRWAQMSEEQRELMIAGIVHDTDRMDAIVRQLVDAARLVSGTLDLFPETVDVGAVVQELAAGLARDPEHPEVRWEGGRLEVLLDPDRLRTAIGAFIEAAVWWAREGPVRVLGSRQDERLRVEVRRAGTELAEEEAEGLFQARRPGTGSGSKIGLFVARGLAEAQGGRATAEVVEGELRLVLELPLPPSA